MKNSKLWAVLVILSFLVLLLPNSANSIDHNTYQISSTGTSGGSVLWQTIGGIPGQITTEIKLVDQTGAGTPDTVLVGTDGGAMVVNLLTGEVYTRYTTLHPVLSIMGIDDIDNGGRTDFVITTMDQDSANIIAVSTETGNPLWKHKPMVEAFTEEDGLLKMETITWCSDSITSTGGADIVVGSWKMVHRLDGSTGRVMWSFEGNNDIWTVVADKDQTGDGKPDVLAGSQDGDIHLLNGETGDMVWEHDLTEIYEQVIVMDVKRGEEGGTVDIKIDLSLWSILAIEDVDRDNIPDVVVSSEDGFITVISGDNGDIIWSKKITRQNEPNIDKDDNVGSQSGIDTVLSFFNPRITTIDDFDGDGMRDILVMGINDDNTGNAKIISSSSSLFGTRSNGKDPGNGGGGKSDDRDDGDEAVELDDESILFTTLGSDGLNIPVIRSTEAIPNPNGTGNYSLLLPHRNKIKLVDTVTMNTTIYFDHPILANVGFRNFQLEFFENPSVSQQELFIMTLGTSGLLVVNPQTQEVLWDLNNLESVEVRDIGDITNDGTGDLMVLSSLGTSSLVRSIYTIDRTTGEELWRFSVSIGDLATMGARGVNIEADLTGDGHMDVLSYRQSDVTAKLLEMGNHSFVTVIDGVDGSIAWERQVTDQLFFNASLNASSGLYEDFNAVNRRISSLDIAPDQNGDGIPDVIVGGEGAQLHLMDGSTGSRLWNKTDADITWLPWYPQIFTLEDGPDPSLVITTFSSLIYFTNFTADGGISSNFSWRYPQNLSSPDNDEIIPGSVIPAGDIDGDGRSDIAYFSIEVVADDDKEGDTYICHILNGLTGENMGPGFSTESGYPPWESFAAGDETDPALFLHDINGNGYKDAVVIKVVGEKRAPPQIAAVDGLTHQDLWVNDDIFQFMIGGGMPLRIIDDSNSDGVSDIAVGSGKWGVEGADIHILDGKTGVDLDIIEYEEQTEFSDWNMAQPVQRLTAMDDLTGDGAKDYIVQRTAVIDDDNVNVVELVDIRSGQLIRQVPIGNAVVKDNGDINSDGRTDILILQGSSMYCLDGAYSLSILSPDDDESLDNEFLLEWDLDGPECEVFTDGISFGRYTTGEASLTLSAGEHEIFVETTDEFGGVLSDSITVNVSETNTPLAINILAIAALAIFIVVTVVLKRARLKKKARYRADQRKKLDAARHTRVRKSKNNDVKPKTTASRTLPKRRPVQKPEKPDEPEPPEKPEADDVELSEEVAE